MEKQLTIDFTPNKYAGYSNLREFINDKSIPDLLASDGAYKMKKQIAADMDYSPSLLSRKLSGCSENVLATEDLENYIEITGDKEPVRYLVHKYLLEEETVSQKRIRELEEELKKARG